LSLPAVVCHRDITVGLCRRRALLHVVVCRHWVHCRHVVVLRRRRISSLHVLSRTASLTYVNIALRHALLHVVVVLSCRCALLLSSDKADHCFLSKCLDDQELGYCLSLCRVWTVKKFTAADDCQL